MSNVKDSITIDLAHMKATCNSGCDIKYARKIIQDKLKQQTGFKGGWTVWFDKDNGEYYSFKLDNAYYFFNKWVGKIL